MAKKSKQGDEFLYLGYRLKPVRSLTTKETDNFLKRCCSIGISNYKDSPALNYRSSNYLHADFYKAAGVAGAHMDVFLFEGKGLVVPGENELFALNIQEAEKINDVRKLFKTVIQVEILSEEPYPSCTSLDDIQADISSGDCSGIIHDSVRNEVIVGREAAKEVERHGTSLDFFRMDKNGFIVEDND